MMWWDLSLDFVSQSGVLLGFGIQRWGWIQWGLVHSLLLSKHANPRLCVLFTCELEHTHEAVLCVCVCVCVCVPFLLVVWCSGAEVGLKVGWCASCVVVVG